MRWAVSILLILNILLAAWIYQQGGWSVGEHTGGRPGIGSITIISETEAPSDANAEQAIESRCYSTGPFEGLVRAMTVVRRITTAGQVAEASRSKQHDGREYWVILPPLAGMSQPELVSRLKAAGVTETWEVAEGEYLGGVSLGLFRERNNAILRRSSIETLGFNPVIIERPGLEESYLVIVRAEGQPEDDAAMLEKLTRDVGGHAFSPFACEAIVPATGNE